MNISAKPANGLAIPFDHTRLDRLMDEAGIDVVVATSKHNVQYLLGGHRANFFDYMDATGVTRYLPVLVYPKGAPEKAAYIGHRLEKFQREVRPLWTPETQTNSAGSVDAMQKAVDHMKKVGLAPKRIAAESPDVVLLDLGLPDGDGKDVIKRAREWSDVPIIVLSARERETEKIEAFDLGADDYVNKPFNIGELLARMRTALRHRMQRKAEIPLLRVGNLEVDAVRHRATRAGAEIKLTPKEFELLSFLARHAGRVVTHKQILTAVWGPAHTEDTQYLRVYVGQLRQKIEEHADDPRIILTEPGIGYRVAEN